jgi:hypothetical protein
MPKRTGYITPASAQPQAVPVTGSKSGGSQRTHQAHPPAVKGLQGSSRPRSAQRLRG